MEIVIIKLGAKGDIVRTLPILLAIKEKYPESKITWITKPECLEIIKTSSYIDNFYTIPIKEENLEKIGHFDILYNFDIDKEAAELAIKINANKKLGFYRKDNYPFAFNFPAEYYLNTLFDDELKKTNKKTYQEMMFEAAELPYKNQHHPVYLTDKDKDYAEAFITKNNINKEKLIGIHLGASSRWPSKVWHSDNLKEFIKKSIEKGYEILLFGGPDEIEYHNKITRELENQQIKIHRNNPQNTDKEFSSLVNQCAYFISGDSFALHISLSLKKPTIGLFFCTSPYEVEDYNLLKKLISPLLYNFFPEKSDQYSEELTKSIPADEVLQTIENFAKDT